LPSLPVGPAGPVGRISPVVPNFVQRVKAATRYVVNGVGTENWFGPHQPLQPFTSQEDSAGAKGRRFDYPTGYNLGYTPRSSETISFADLRQLAQNCDILRGVIEARKDQIAALDWAIRPRESVGEGGGESKEAHGDVETGRGLGSDGTSSDQRASKRDPSGSGAKPGMGGDRGQAAKPQNLSGAGFGVPSGNRPATVQRSELNTIKLPDDMKKDIRDVTDFLMYPDKEHTWDQWMRCVNEDMFVIDAATLYKRQTRGGDLYALEPIDGATIFPLLDATGRRPTDPGDPAYQQILHGVPAADYTASELLYMPRNVRADRVYGLSPVEQVVITVNTSIRRAIYQLDYYLAGSTPDAFVGLPEGWTLQNIRDFQSWFDGLMSGNLANRRKVRFMPGKFTYVETKEPPLKDDYDEWLARVICFVFSISPEPFVTHLNRATAGTARSRALEEGLMPSQRWWKGLLDQIIRFDLKHPELEFVFLEDREQDPKAQMDVDTGYVKAGIFSIDEVRKARGKLPVGDAAEQPMLATTSGYVPIGALTGPDAVAAMAGQGNAGLAGPGSPSEAGGGPGHGKGGVGRQGPGFGVPSTTGAPGSSSSTAKE
jgi:hypothetical protein